MTEGAKKQGRGAGTASHRTASWVALSMGALSLASTALAALLLVRNLSYPNPYVFDLWVQGIVIPITCSTVKKRLSEVVSLLQVYSRLAELEIVSGEAPRFPGKGYVAFPKDTAEKAKEWGEGEAEREKQRAEFVEKLRAVGKDPRAALEGMG